MVTKNTNTKAGKAAAALALPVQTDEGAMRAAILAAGTPAEWRAAADKAAGFTAAADASAWTTKLLGTRSIGEAMYGAYKATVLLADSNAVVPAASDVTFTTLMGKAYSTTKTEYEAADRGKRVGPGRRSWSSLAEDYDCWRTTSDDVWLAAYETSLGDSKRGIRAYTSFYKAAEAEAERVTEAGETSQMRSARTKREQAAAATAEVERQAAARQAAADKTEADKAAAATKAADAATAWITHAATHPTANLVPGVDLTCAAAAALSPVKLRELSAALLALAAEAERVAAEAAKAAKADKAGSKVADTVAAGQAAAQAAADALTAHDTAADAAALGAAAEAAVRPSVLSLLTPEQVAALSPEQVAALA